MRLWIGLFLAAVFDGILLGSSLPPQIGVVLGFSAPQSVYDPFWKSWIIRTIEILSLILTLGAFALVVSGFLRYRLIRYECLTPLQPAPPVPGNFMGGVSYSQSTELTD